jgi:hypothetical protein
MPGFWRKCRIAFRCARFVVWGALLLLLAAYAWINLVGLPDFLKTRLVTALHQRGVQLEFSRLRLRLVHGLICDNVRIGAAENDDGPEFRAAEVQLRINFPALLHRRLQVDGLVLRQGKFNLPLAGKEALVFTNLQGELRILPEDTWSLDHFRVDVAGATFTLAGAIAHAPECRNWKLFSSVETPDRGSVQASLQNLSQTLKQIHFTGRAQLNARIDGDARDVHSFTLTLSARAPAVQTPWCSLSNLEFATHIFAPTNAPPMGGGPAWSFWTNLQPFRLDWLARGQAMKSPWGQAEVINGSGTWGESREVRALALTFNVRVSGAQTPWFNGRNLDFAARVLAPTNTPAAGDPAWGYWTNLQPFQLDWLARGAGLKTGSLSVDTLDCRGSWQSPKLAVTECTAKLGGGKLAADATVDVATHQLECGVHSGFDLHVVEGWLPGPVRQQLARITWAQPPQIIVDGRLVLPPWTQPVAAWNFDCENGLQLQGTVAATNLQYAGLMLNSAQARFAYSNQLWSLSHAELSQGRTALTLSGEESEVTKNFQCSAEGQVDCESFRHFLTNTNVAHGFECLTLRDPVSFALAAQGNRSDFSTLCATGRVTATDFAIRNQWMDRVAATLSYTNLTAEFFNLELTRAHGAEHVAAEGLTLDIARERLYLHHAKGHVLPAAVGAAIGPQTAEAMAPYVFLAIPEAVVDGCIPLKFKNGDLVTDDADLRFDLVGNAPFRWRKFETPRIAGTIRWLANNLIITNVTAECYGGTADGWGVFNVETPGDGTDFAFMMEGTNVDFNAMGKALWSATNQLRGALSGTVSVTSANSSDWKTWNGYGQMQLQNGLLWNAPVFGRMSPVLHSVTPGLDIGYSRATDGAGRFVMTNGVIFTDTLEIRSLTMRLDYVGTVDLEENVVARVRAQLLRNTPVLGSLFSAVLSPVSKAFECDVTGTLDNPVITPTYIPFTRVLNAPLHPIRTVEKIFAAPATNSPAKP